MNYRQGTNSTEENDPYRRSSRPSLTRKTTLDIGKEQYGGLFDDWLGESAGQATHVPALFPKSGSHSLDSTLNHSLDHRRVGGKGRKGRPEGHGSDVISNENSSVGYTPSSSTFSQSVVSRMGLPGHVSPRDGFSSSKGTPREIVSDFTLATLKETSSIGSCDQDKINTNGDQSEKHLENNSSLAQKKRQRFASSGSKTIQVAPNNVTKDHETFAMSKQISGISRLSLHSPRRQRKIGEDRQFEENHSAKLFQNSTKDKRQSTNSHENTSSRHRDVHSSNRKGHVLSSETNEFDLDSLSDGWRNKNVMTTLPHQTRPRRETEKIIKAKMTDLELL